MLVYTPNITPRFSYTLEVCFSVLVHVKYELTDDLNAFKQSEGVRINYSNEVIEDSIQIIPSGLLMEQTIEPQEITFKVQNELPVLFGQEKGGDISFDVFSAAFYKLSRYEEYLDFNSDEHSRFPLKESLSVKHGFYQSAVVHHWLDSLIVIIQNKYTSFTVDRNTYKFSPTFDIDNAYAYLHKNWIRTTGGLGKDLLTNSEGLKEKLKVFKGKEKDPYDNYDFLIENSESSLIRPLFFILTSNYGKFDKNISPKHPAFEKLINELNRHGEIGIHPSYQSNDSIQALKSEINTLKQISQREIHKSRQHYLKIKFPDSFENLIDSGISDDYSLGYSEASGFRSGCAVPYPFFNLKTNEATKLMLHPFSFMDATYLYYDKTSFDDIKQKMKVIIDEIKAVRGTFYPIWHNECFGGENGDKWKDLYLWMNNYSKA